MVEGDAPFGIRSTDSRVVNAKKAVAAILMLPLFRKLRPGKCQQFKWMPFRIAKLECSYATGFFGQLLRAIFLNGRPSSNGRELAKRLVHVGHHDRNVLK